MYFRSYVLNSVDAVRPLSLYKENLFKEQRRRAPSFVCSCDVLTDPSVVVAPTTGLRVGDAGHPLGAGYLAGDCCC